MNEICKSGKQLERATFRTSRLLDFCSEKELIAQTGHRPEAWPLVVLQELVDNALDACEEARTAPEISSQYSAMARIASSLPGTRWAIASGSELESRIAITGMFNTLASATAMCSLLVSITNSTSGRPPISLMPPSARSSLLRCRVSLSSSFLVKPVSPSSSCSSTSRRRLIDLEMVFQLVSMPPSQR